MLCPGWRAHTALPRPAQSARSRSQVHKPKREHIATQQVVECERRHISSRDEVCQEKIRKSRKRRRVPACKRSHRGETRATAGARERQFHGTVTGQAMARNAKQCRRNVSKDSKPRILTMPVGNYSVHWSTTLLLTAQLVLCENTIIRLVTYWGCTGSPSEFSVGRLTQTLYKASQVFCSLINVHPIFGNCFLIQKWLVQLTNEHCWYMMKRCPQWIRIYSATSPNHAAFEQHCYWA